MAPKKLSDSDKQEILRLYRQPLETTSTLASRYGVSNSTISRILKQSLDESEYEALVQQKRTGVFKEFEPSEAIAEPEPSTKPVHPVEKPKLVVKTSVEASVEMDDESEGEEPSSDSGLKRRRRRRSLSIEAEFSEVSEIEGSEEDAFAGHMSTLDVPATAADGEPTAKPDYDRPEYAEEASIYSEVMHEELLNPEEDFGDLEDLGDDDDDLDDDGDDDDFAGIRLKDFSATRFNGSTLVSILPLSEAPIPKPCYLVVDRFAELITRPLKDFADLGQIPDGEIQMRTLPVFDNHRVARRFSNRRTQRVVKIPDGKLLQKTSPYLQAKGITRLLIDGQLYSLERS